MRAQDIIARFGGEEFVVVLPNTGALKAKQIGDRLRLAIADMILPTDGQEIRVSTSVGGYWSPSSFDAVDGLRKADRALYRAKENGRNRTEFEVVDTIAA